MRGPEAVRGLLIRGMLAGLAAGVLMFVFAKLFGEPQVDKAIAFEEAHSPPSSEAPLVSRSMQASLGLLTGTLVYATALGGIFSILCAVVSGTTQDVFFQLAFAGYVGAFFNLNPFIERDGYHMLVDILREPGLRRRARAQLSRRLSGQGRLASDSPVLARYAVFGVVWSVVLAVGAIWFTQRYAPITKPDAIERDIEKLLE